MRKPKWLKEIEGAHALTQKFSRETLEIVVQVGELLRRVYVAPSIYVIRVRRQGIQFASYMPGRGKQFRWTSKLEEATTFQAEASAKGALRKLRRRRGETLELMRILP